MTRLLLSNKLYSTCIHYQLVNTWDVEIIIEFCCADICSHHSSLWMDSKNEEFGVFTIGDLKQTMRKDLTSAITKTSKPGQLTFKEHKISTWHSALYVFWKPTLHHSKNLSQSFYFFYTLYYIFSQLSLVYVVVRVTFFNHLIFFVS